MTMVRLVGGLEYISEKDYDINHSNDILTWIIYRRIIYAKGRSTIVLMKPLFQQISNYTKEEHMQTIDHNSHDHIKG